jgi:hypothetical protein
MRRLVELLGGLINRDETDDEQDVDYRKNKGSSEIYHGVKKYKKGGLYTGQLKNGKR